MPKIAHHGSAEMDVRARIPVSGRVIGMNIIYVRYIP